MKYQQVSVDFVNMVFTACSYLALAGAAWVFLRLLQACFSLPRHLRKQNDVQALLQEKVDSYEKYLLECEEKEKLIASGELTEEEGAEGDEKSVCNEKADGPSNEAKWKERRECLEMLKRELKRVRDGGDIYDWDYLLEEEEKLEEEEQKQENEAKIEKEEGEEENKELSPNDVDCELIDDSTREETSNEEKKDK